MLELPGTHHGFSPRQSTRNNSLTKNVYDGLGRLTETDVSSTSTPTSYATTTTYVYTDSATTTSSIKRTAHAPRQRNPGADGLALRSWGPPRGSEKAGPTQWLGAYQPSHQQPQHPGSGEVPEFSDGVADAKGFGTGIWGMAIQCGIARRDATQSGCAGRRPRSIALLSPGRAA
jgi:hypothetical protein